MDEIWDKTIDFLAKINGWIPLVAVLFAGIGLVGVTLILAITGCAMRRRLVPHWLIWTYFTFATFVIFAHSHDLATVVAWMEVPVLVVLLCYIFRTLFTRRPRYTYVKETVYARALAKGRVVEVKDAADNAGDADNSDDAREVENEVVKVVDDEQLNQHKQALALSRKEQRKAEKAAREYEKAARDAEKAARDAEEKAAAERERAEREIAAAKKAAADKAAAEVEAAKRAAADQAAAEVEAAEKAARIAQEKAAAEKEKAAAERERAAREIAAAKKAAAERAAQANAKTTTTTTTFNLPVVEPIPDKTYEATREPMIEVTPISETMPDLKMPNTTIQLRASNTVSRPAPRPTPTTNNTSMVRMGGTTAVTTRPTTTTVTTTTPNRVVTTETTTTPVNAYTQMYNPRVVKTTTTTTTTTTNTNTNTLNAVSATRTVNGQTTRAAAIQASSTAGTTTKPATTTTSANSTQDIMAAIERLRASMKK